MTCTGGTIFLFPVQDKRDQILRAVEILFVSNLNQKYSHGSSTEISQCLCTAEVIMQ